MRTSKIFVGKLAPEHTFFANDCAATRLISGTPAPPPPFFFFLLLLPGAMDPARDLALFPVLAALVAAAAAAAAAAIASSLASSPGRSITVPRGWSSPLPRLSGGK